MPSWEKQQALQTARVLVNLGHPLELVMSNPLIAEELRDYVRAELEKDQNFTLTPARMLVADPNRKCPMNR